MSTHSQRVGKPWRARAAAVLSAILAVSGLALATPAIAAPEDCVGGVISNDNIAVSYTAGGGDDSVEAWESFRYDVALTDLDGMAEGCTATVQLDADRFSGLQDTTIYLNADGTTSDTPGPTTVAEMEVDADTLTMTFTLTDYASTHTNVTAGGWVEAQINSSFERGEVVPIEVTVNGATTTIGEVTGEECPNVCGEPPTQANKWGAEDGTGNGSVTIRTPLLTDYSDVTIEDELLSTDQQIDSVNWVRAYNCVNTWGDAGALDDAGKCDTDSSISASWTGTNPWTVAVADPSVTGPVFFALNLQMTFTGEGPWKDRATIKLGDEVVGGPVEATVKKYRAGGNAGGEDQGTFSVTKSIDWDGAEPFQTSAFEGTWSASKDGENVGSGIWSVAGGETWTSDPLPTGSVVTLEETTDTDLWTPSWDSSSLTIVGGDNVAATVTNTLTTGWFEVKKIVQWSGIEPWDITFTGTWTAKLGETEVGSGVWSVNEDNEWRWVGPKLPTGSVVTLEEDATPGWTAVWNDEQTITIPERERTCPEVTNTLNVGQFSITKDVEWGDVEEYDVGPFTGTWQATLPSGGGTQDGTWEVADGETWTSPELPAGATVTYTEDAVDPAEAVAWTAGWSAEGLEIVGGQTVEADLTNTAELRTGVFTASKALEGDAAAQVPADATFTLSYSYPAGTGYAAGSGELQLMADGSTTTSDPLPLGAVLTLEELAPAPVPGGTWGLPELSVDTVTIVEDEEQAVHVTVTNTITVPVVPAVPAVPAASAPAQVLAVTGAQFSGWVGVAGLMLVLGGLTLAAVRRRVHG